MATLAWRPLALPDEGRYASVADEMWRGNGWLPTLNSLPFFHKPPLSYWLNMVFMGLFGHHPWTARVAPALGAWLMGAALFAAQRRWQGEQVAWMSLGVLASTPFFFVGAQYGNLDMLVAGCISVAVLALARAVDVAPAEPLHRHWLCAGWLACALAVLAKGLIGFLLPGMVLLPWLLARGRWRHALGLFHPLGLLCFAVVAGPWFVSMQNAFPEFADYFFMEQHFRRFASAAFNNVRPWWFLGAVMLGFTLPWSIWGWASIKRAWSQKNSVVSTGQNVNAVFYAWWLCVVVVFFSWPSSKLVGYVLPALVPWCALLQLGFSQGEPQTSGIVSRRWRWTALAAGALCWVLVGALTWWRPTPNHSDAAQQLQTQAGPHDRVVMVDEYFYDIPFLAGLKRPVMVVSDWASPEVGLHDNWRKELFDAARFAPDRGRSVLLTWQQWDQALCLPADDSGLPLSVSVHEKTPGRSQVFSSPLGGIAESEVSHATAQSAAVWYLLKPGHQPLKPLPSSARKLYGDAGVELWRAAMKPCP